jgi:hypothetical protein
VLANEGHDDDDDGGEFATGCGLGSVLGGAKADFVPARQEKKYEANDL